MERIFTQAYMDEGEYQDNMNRRGARHLGISWKVNDKRKLNKQMSSTQKKNNRKKSQVRARIEHCFRVMKCQFGYKKARYKGLDKNRSQVMTILGLVNLYMHRAKLMA